MPRRPISVGSARGIGANTPASRRKAKQNTSKTAGRVNNQGLDDIAKEVARQLAGIGVAAGPTASKAGSLAQEGVTQAPKKAAAAGKAATNAVTEGIQKFNVFQWNVMRRVTWGVAGGILIMFALIRFTAPAVKTTAEVAAVAVPAGRLAKTARGVGKVAKVAS